MRLGLAVASLASCVPPVEITVTSPPHLEKGAPIERVLIYVRFPLDELHRGVEAGLTKRLASCHVTSTFLEYDPMALDPAGDLTAAMKEFQPTTIMVISKTAGTVYAEGMTTLSTRFELLEARSETVIWAANTLARVNGANPVTSFATRIVTRLRDDGVLTRCPLREAYPGCRDDRRQALIDASQLDDKLARGRAKDAAPSCDVANTASPPATPPASGS